MMLLLLLLPLLVVLVWLVNVDATKCTNARITRNSFACLSGLQRISTYIHNIFSLLYLSLSFSTFSLSFFSLLCEYICSKRLKWCINSNIKQSCIHKLHVNINSMSPELFFSGYVYKCARPGREGNRVLFIHQP